MVSEVECFRDAADEVEERLGLHRSIAQNFCREGFTIEQLEDEEWRPVLRLPEVEDPHDTGVFYAPDRFCFVEKARRQHLVAHHLGLEDFKRDLAIDELVACRPYRSARAGANEAQQAIALMDDVALSQRHGAETVP